MPALRRRPSLDVLENRVALDAVVGLRARAALRLCSRSDGAGPPVATVAGRVGKSGGSLDAVVGLRARAALRLCSQSDGCILEGPQRVAQGYLVDRVAMADLDACVGAVGLRPEPLYGFAPNRMDVFWKDPNGLLRDTWWTGSQWQTSTLASGPLGSAPEPLYGFAPNRMDVFWKDPNGSLRDTWWTGSQWQTSTLASGPLGSAPEPLYGFAPNRMDVFWKDPNGSLRDTWWTGSQWQTSTLASGPLGSAPEPLYGFAPNRMDVFWKDPNGSLRDTWWTGSQWQTSTLASGPLGSAPEPLYGFAPNRMDVFWKDPNGSLRDTWWTGSQWQTSTLASGPLGLRARAALRLCSQSDGCILEGPQRVAQGYLVDRVAMADLDAYVVLLYLPGAAGVSPPHEPPLLRGKGKLTLLPLSGADRLHFSLRGKPAANGRRP